MKNVIPVFLLTFFITLLLGLVLLPVLKKIKASQTILHYVKEHSDKQGIPTMGGLFFIFSVIISFLLYASQFSKYGAVAAVIMFAYGTVGFLDDFIKVYFKRNLGLKAYQKIIFQVSIAIIASFFIYYNGLTVLDIPFSKTSVDFKWWIIPVTMVVFLSTTNCVNLTDGLDGLAGGTSFVCFAALAALIFSRITFCDISGDTILYEEYYNLFYLCVSACGAMLGFLCFNGFPARVFMGDTGSLALGGLIASLAILSGYSLFIPFIGIMFVVSGISVIAQVFSFQVFKKRIILMAPYHHHLQQKGHHEAKITLAYMTVTLIVSVVIIYFHYFVY